MSDPSLMRDFGWREYGPRVGFGRMLEIFDRLGIQPTAILDSDEIAARYLGGGR